MELFRKLGIEADARHRGTKRNRVTMTPVQRLRRNKIVASRYYGMQRLRRTVLPTATLAATSGIMGMMAYWRAAVLSLLRGLE